MSDIPEEVLQRLDDLTCSVADFDNITSVDFSTYSELGDGIELIKTLMLNDCKLLIKKIEDFIELRKKSNIEDYSYRDLFELQALKYFLAFVSDAVLAVQPTIAQNPVHNNNTSPAAKPDRLNSINRDLLEPETSPKTIAGRKINDSGLHYKPRNADTPCLNESKTRAKLYDLYVNVNYLVNQLRERVNEHGLVVDNEWIIVRDNACTCDIWSLLTYKDYVRQESIPRITAMHYHKHHIGTRYKMLEMLSKNPAAAQIKRDIIDMIVLRQMGLMYEPRELPDSFLAFFMANAALLGNYWNLQNDVFDEPRCDCDSQTLEDNIQSARLLLEPHNFFIQSMFAFSKASSHSATNMLHAILSKDKRLHKFIKQATSEEDEIFEDIEADFVPPDPDMINDNITLSADYPILHRLFYANLVARADLSTKSYGQQHINSIRRFFNKIFKKPWDVTVTENLFYLYPYLFLKDMTSAYVTDAAFAVYSVIQQIMEPEPDNKIIIDTQRVNPREDVERDVWKKWINSHEIAPIFLPLARFLAAHRIARRLVTQFPDEDKESPAEQNKRIMNIMLSILGLPECEQLNRYIHEELAGQVADPDTMSFMLHYGVIFALISALKSRFEESALSYRDSLVLHKILDTYSQIVDDYTFHTQQGNRLHILTNPPRTQLCHTVECDDFLTSLYVKHVKQLLELIDEDICSLLQ